MPNVINCLITVFADDTKVYTDALSSEQRTLLQSSVDGLLVWSNDWQMKFNSNKCKILHVGENNPAISYYMDASELESSGVEKDLGVLVDNKLKFDQHINETIQKIK